MADHDGLVDRLLDAVRAAADRGVGVLLVQQHVRKAMAVADRVQVMQRGRIVMEGTAAEVGADIGQVERAYLSGVVDDERGRTT